MSINIQQALRKCASLINHPPQPYVGDLPTRPLATEPLPQRQHVPNKSRIGRTSQSSKTVSFLFRVVILLALLVTTVLINQQTNYQQHAAANPSWTLMFDDEFNGSSVDTTKWRMGDALLNGDWWCDSTNYSNTSNANMVTESNGPLHIQAEQVPYAGKNYQGGCVSTYTKFSFLYGKVIVRARMPQMTQSWWPGLWMLPANAGQDFEIDILEMLNEPYPLYFNNHDWRDNIHNGTSAKPGPDYSAGYHDFEVEWSPSAIIWRVDGVEYFRVTNTVAISNEPMFLILNTNISSATGWAGAPNSTSVFPGQMDVAYVHIYQASTATPTPAVVPATSTPTPTVRATNTPMPTPAVVPATSTPTPTVRATNTPMPTFTPTPTPKKRHHIPGRSSRCPYRARCRRPR